jgi:hypothetical protein
MQYTGLRDSNNINGYEGDISEDFSTGERYKIEFVDGAFCLVDKSGVGHEILDLQHQYIIGNIYENPELLDSRGKSLTKEAAATSTLKWCSCGLPIHTNNKQCESCRGK